MFGIFIHADHIRGTVAGKSYVDPAIIGKLLEQTASKQVQPASKITEKLTEREEDVLRLMARGFSNSEIAHKIYLSEGTVRNHVSAIFAKLDVSDRTQAVIIAIRHGLDSDHKIFGKCQTEEVCGGKKHDWPMSSLKCCAAYTYE